MFQARLAQFTRKLVWTGTAETLYQSRTVAPVGFYSELERFGVVVSRSVLVNIFPDSGTTLVGSLIEQDGNFYSYDIDYY